MSGHPQFCACHCVRGPQAAGSPVPFIHSTFGTANERDLLLGQISGRLEPQVNVVICTNAFGMGLDIPDVRLVVHWQRPASVEDYLQEFGRGGRDGEPAVAILFTEPKDEGLLRHMAEKTSRAAGDQGQEVLAEKYLVIGRMRAGSRMRSSR